MYLSYAHGVASRPLPGQTPGHALDTAGTTKGATLSHDNIPNNGYFVSEALRLTSDFPMTVTGKIQKFRMREISVEALGLSVMTRPWRCEEVRQ